NVVTGIYTVGESCCENKVGCGLGLVRAIVPREPNVAIDPEHRAVLEVAADRAQPGSHLGDEAENGVAHDRLVVTLIRQEPLAVVVLPELPQELEQLGGELRVRHDRRKMPRRRIPWQGLLRREPDVTSPRRATPP